MAGQGSHSRRFSGNTFYFPGHYSNNRIGTTMASSAKVRPFSWLSVQEMFWTEGGKTWGVYKLWIVGYPNPFLSWHHLLVPLGIFLITNILLYIRAVWIRSRTAQLQVSSQSSCCIVILGIMFVVLTFWCFEWSFPGRCVFIPHTKETRCHGPCVFFSTCKTSIATICHHRQCHGTFHVWMQDCLKALWRTPGAYRM